MVLAAKRALRLARRLLPRQERSDPELPAASRTAPGSGLTPTQRKDWLEQRLGEFHETLGPQHPRSITARNNLAAAHAQLGQHGTAVMQFEGALEEARRVLGPLHPQTDVIAENLACCYEDAQRFGDAAAQWEAIVQQRAEGAGAGAAETVSARASLAAAYRKAGQLDAALAHAERAVGDANGAEAVHTERLRIGLARTYREAGQLDAAVRQLRMVQAQRRRRLGAAHADTLAVRHRLGQWQREAERGAEAVETLRGAYFDALSAAGDPEVRLLALRIRRDLARVYRAQGRHKDIAELQ